MEDLILNIELAEPIREDGSFDGYACIWKAVDYYRRRFPAGSFDGPLARFAAAARYPAILWEHNKLLTIGSQVLTRDDKGLHVAGQLWIADTPAYRAVDDARKAYNLIRTCTYGMSFRCPLNPAYITMDAEGVQTVSQVDDLWETTITSSPACNIARVEAVASRPDARALLNRIHGWRASLRK